MDTSKKYIEMCRKADEIQQQWNEDTRQEGDFFSENSSIDVFYSCPEEDNLTYVEHPVWLPRLDQLLGLITYLSWVEFDKRCKIAARDAYIRGGMSWRDPCDITKEQAGLMVVMTENTRKRWNDSTHEWVDDRIKRD